MSAQTGSSGSDAARAALDAHRALLEGMQLREAFAHDVDRARRYRLKAAGLTLDYSRNLISDETLRLLTALAGSCDVVAQRAAMLGGEAINLTEGRAVLHTLLRGTDPGRPLAQMDDVLAARKRMKALVEHVRGGAWRGAGGDTILDVVNIGIGGSHLGPAFVSEALAHLADGKPRCHFVSNVDPRDLDRVLSALDPLRTLFVVASKSFTTLETRENALSARRWVLAGGCDEAMLNRHFVAVSANVPRAVEFGIAAENVLPMWDWVGGRYSLWSAIGLPIAIGIGMDPFEGLLLGAHRMDCHFRDAPLGENMPVVLAMLSVWYRNFWGCASHAVIPYDQGLARLPEYLQQLIMESNGKSVARNGEPLRRSSAGVIWGAAGTNGQHSFHQMLHQGTDVIPVDFVLPLGTHSANHAQHAHLVANCIAQGQALMLGRTLAEACAELRERGVPDPEVEVLAPHLVMPGNRPSNTIVMEKVVPETLGALIALYEHRTAVEGFVWGLNSFDQFGVELGKRLSESVHCQLLGEDPAAADVDASTRELVRMYRERT